MDTVPAPDITAAAPTDAPGHPRTRATVYCIALACLAGILMFWELGGDALTGDEAQYALVVQNIRASGNWIDLTPYPPTPYLQKPPLYFWLTASTYDALDRSEFAYRAWSAAAGAGAVVLTCALGAMLFTPEVGGLAGLLLLLNRSFLLLHGARSGTFDALVTFLTLAAIVAYVCVTRGKREWLGWIVVGALAGLASITKPYVCVPLVALLGIHAILFRRQAPVIRRLGGVSIALLVLLAVASPWYVAMGLRHDHFVDEMFRRNLVARVTVGVDDKHLRDWAFYLGQITKSSPAFFFSIPAMLYTLAASTRGLNRERHALLGIIGLGWIVLFTLSASKAVHYVYPVFPLIAIMIADGAVQLLRAISLKFAGSRPRFATAVVLVLGVAMTFQYARGLFHSIPADRSPYVPWEMYKVLEPAIDAGKARVVFCGFPDGQTDWRSRLHLRARDCYYLEQMRRSRGAERTPDLNGLAKILAERRPSLLVLSRHTDVNGFLARPEIAGRIENRFVYPHQGYQFVGIDLATLLEPTAKPGESSVAIQIDDASEQGSFRLTLTPPVRGSARLAARLRLADGSRPRALRYTLAMDSGPGERKRLADDVVSVHADGTVGVSAMIEQDLWPNGGPKVITLTLRAADASTPEPVRTTLEEVRLTMLPHIPPEHHPRR